MNYTQKNKKSLLNSIFSRIVKKIIYRYLFLHKLKNEDAG